MFMEKLKTAAKAAREFIVRRKGAFAAVAAVGAAACMFYIVSAPVFVGASATERVLPIYRVVRDNKSVSLTFDMSYGSEDTHYIIEALARYGVRATFFVVGEWAQEHPDAVLALHEAGHEIMNCSDSYPHLSRLTADEIRAEAEACSDTVEALTGVRPTLFRCPYGEYDDNVISTLKQIGLIAVQWDVDSLDWKGLSASEITNRVVSKVKNGSIILMHNNSDNILDALRLTLSRLKVQGYKITSVSDLVYNEGYTIDRNGIQHKLKGE